MEAALFIWFAGVIGGVAKFLGFCGTLLILGTLGVTAVRFMNWGDECGRAGRNGESDPKRPPLKTATWTVILGVFLVLLANILPDQKTAYLAGGAYLGQKAFQSETAGKVLEVVNMKLDDYVEEMKKEALKSKKVEKE